MTSGKVLTPIVDKNGKQTNVWKNPDGAKSNRSAGTNPTKASVEPVLSPAEKLAEEIRKGDETYSLYYVGQAEGLQPEQINQFLSGDDEFDNALDDAFSEQRYDYSEEKAKKLAEEAGLDWDDLDYEDQDDIRNAVQEKDDGGLVKDLLRETFDQLMRLDLDNVDDIMDRWITDENGKPDRELIGQTAYGHLADPKIRERALAGELARYGIDASSGKNKEQLASLVSEGSSDWHEGVKLSVIWYGDVAQANVGEYIDGELKDERELTFKDKVHVLALNTYSGSGWEAEFEVGSATFTASTDNPVFLDSEPSSDKGYGWDDTAGVIKSAYRSNMESNWK